MGPLSSYPGSSPDFEVLDWPVGELSQTTKSGSKG